jgi:hypothetical protein
VLLALDRVENFETVCGDIASVAESREKAHRDCLQPDEIRAIAVYLERAFVPLGGAARV